MCTVSAIPIASGLRLVCNRDELRSRPAARPPIVRRAGELFATMPVDPPSGGTWIATNSAGIVFVLLNADGPSVAPGSRGTIIPNLVHCESLNAAVARLVRMRLTDFRGFRLLLLERTRRYEAAWDGRRVALFADEVTEPFVLTSSTLGDERVLLPRRRLFESIVVPATDRVAAQNEFHAHHWPEHPELSVLMSREDACTVSRTTVELADSGVRMWHVDLAPGAQEAVA